MKIGSAFTFFFDQEDASDFKSIITASGPLEQDEQKLRETIQSVLYQAEINKFKSICFPIISTGVYSFDFESACKIFGEEIKDFLENRAKHLMVVRLVNNRQQNCEKICQLFKKSIGETNLSLTLTIETLGITRPDPESEFHWFWEEGKKRKCFFFLIIQLFFQKKIKKK